MSDATKNDATDDGTNDDASKGELELSAAIAQAAAVVANGGPPPDGAVKQASGDESSEAKPGAEVIRWWWVRHAPATAGGFVGWTDIAADLSDERSLSTLRMALPEDAALLCSDLTRAAQTAETLNRRTWSRLPAQPTLREQHFGDWEGRAFDSLTAEEAATFWAEPADARPPGGESFADLCDRVAQTVITCLTGDHSDIVAVAHAGTVRAALALALDLPPRQAMAFEVAPLSLTRIDWLAGHGAWRVGCVNVTL